MSVNNNFQNIQKVLTDFSAQGREVRKQVGLVTRAIEIASVLGIVAAAVLVVASAVGVVAHPILGTLGIVLGTAMLISFYESFRVSRNIRNIIDDTLSLSNIWNRVLNGLSPEQFVSATFKGTLILGPFFSNFFVEQLKNAV